MSITVTYLFDPFCGWCYGASPAIQKLGQQPGIQLALAPTGLFAGRGGRTMDAAFADFAWSNDLRIQKLTGQRFTDLYRTQVLGKTGSRFDSATATAALTAVALTSPLHELETLKVLQEARYVHGLDTTALPVVEKLLRDMALGSAADRLLSTDTELLAASAERVRKAQGLMQTLAVPGVPALVVNNEKGSRLLGGEVVYGGFESLLNAISY